MLRGVAAGPASEVNDTDSNPGTPVSASVGMSGAAALRFRLAMPRGRMRAARTCGRSAGTEPNMTSMRPADHVRNGRGASFVRYMQHVDPGLQLEELHRKMQSAANAGRSVNELTRLRLRERNELFDVFDGHRVVDD